MVGAAYFTFLEIYRIHGYREGGFHTALRKCVYVSTMERLTGY